MTTGVTRLPLNRLGMTLIEMLVATAATLMLMGALAQIFSVFGSAVTNSRSMIDQDARLRSVAWRLRSDLTGATARTLPPLEPASGEGYFEIIEGPLNDNTAISGSTTIVADTDDILLLTTRSSETAFLGKADTAMAESPTAEVAWFLRPSTPTTIPATYTLYRRQLLVVGYAGFGPFVNNNTALFTNPRWSSQWINFYNDYDISVRLEGNRLIPNTLSDLTRRESRFMHNPNPSSGSFPYEFQSGAAGLFFDSTAGSSRVGEDVVLTNVISFDIRVFDPAAPVSIPLSGGTPGDAAAIPGDASFSASSAIATGCYVDLANNTLGVISHFNGSPRTNYLNSSGLFVTPTWDTWSTHYETNCIDDDGLAGIDQGSNGLDDAVGTWPQNGQVDEPEEQETSPPYPFPLRGIEIRIRCYEPSSRQVRQVTVRHTFVPH